MAQTYQNSPYEDFAEVGLGIAVFVSLVGSLGPSISSIFKKKGESALVHDDYFGNHGGHCGLIDGYILFNAYPKLMTLLFVIMPSSIVVFFSITESVLFHIDPEEANLGHYIAEGLLFGAVYFISLMSLTFTFPLIQSEAAEKGWIKIFDKFPIQYQDRFYTACGLPALSFFNTFLLLTKINSTDFMEQDVVDRFLIIDIMLPWAMLIRCRVFIDGFYYFMPAFEFNEAYGGLIVFLLIQFGFLGAICSIFGTLNDPCLYILFSCYFLFLVLPKLSFFVFYKRVEVQPTSKTILNFTLPVRKALFDGADIVMKKIPLEGLNKVGGIGLKNYVFVWSKYWWKLPAALPGYVVKEETEDVMQSEILITRKLKGFQGVFAFTSLVMLYAMGLPLLLFFRITNIKYYRTLNVLEAIRPDEKLILWITKPVGRTVYPLLGAYQRTLFVVDSAGIEPSFSYFLRFFMLNKYNDAGREAFFLWNCSNFMEVMIVTKFLQSLVRKEEWDGGDAEGIRCLIVCQLTPDKVWGVKDVIDGTGAKFVWEKIYNGVANIENLNGDNLFSTAEIEETAVVALGSSAQTASVKHIHSRIGESYFKVIYDPTFTGRNAYEPNGFFQVS